MTIRATKFTPEVLLSAPRRSPGVPNGSGTKVLFTVSTHDFDSHKQTTELRMLDISTQESSLLTTGDGVSEPNWIDDDVLFLAPGEKGKTLIKIAKSDNFAASEYVAGEINASASNLRLQNLSNGDYAIALAALTTPSGDLFNAEEAPEAHTTGRLYDSMFVRHWDNWKTSNKNSIWYGVLKHSEESSKYSLGSLTNALRNTPLECPIPPFGGTDHFDINENGGIIFVAKDPDLNEAFNTKCNVYVVPLQSFASTSPPAPRPIYATGFEGAKTSPVFSPDGKKAVFLAMKKNGYEADKNHILVLIYEQGGYSVKQTLCSSEREDGWSLSPSAATWSVTGESLYLIAEDRGRACLWTLSFNPQKTTGPPKFLMGQGSVSSARPLTDSPGHIFVSTSSLVDNSAYFLVQTLPGLTITPISSNSRNGAAFGLSPMQVDSVSYPGAKRKIQAWVIKPSNFTEEKKWPLAYFVHGGPQGAWLDSWSTRWNPAVFAEQGYVVIAPNFTGSTGFGQDFTDAIQEQWGGLPYEDLVKGFQWIESELPYVDTERAVCLGASYGGYMMNWIQGHALGKKFKAMVCHDGVFNIPAGQLASDELYFPEHDLGGKWSENKEAWLRWDPSKHVDKWSTPMLVIHSAKDYRLCISEGLAAFSALQSRGIESQFLTYPDENHWVLKPENSLLWHAAVFDWINKFVGLPLYGDSGLAKVLKDQAKTGATRPKVQKK